MDNEMTETVEALDVEEAAESEALPGTEAADIEPADAESEKSALDPEEEMLAVKAALPNYTIGADFIENERYCQLRALGLSPREAYLATSPLEKRADNRAHLTGTPRISTAPTTGMTREELDAVRPLFEDLGDAEIKRLYKKVAK